MVGPTLVIAALLAAEAVARPAASGEIMQPSAPSARAATAPPLSPMPPIRLSPIAPLGPGAKKEISGIVRGGRTHHSQPVFWTQNDSGDEPRIYPILADGTLIQTVREPGTPGTLIGGAINSDWEDLALLRRADGTSQIIAADFGNNSNARQDLTLYFIEEPEPTESKTTFTSKVLFRYPDQAAWPSGKGSPGGINFDAEAIFTVGEEVFILTKNRSDSFTKLYRLDDRVPGVVNTLTYLDRFDTGVAAGGGAGMGSQITGADCSPDGLRLALITYTHLWLIDRASHEEAWFGSGATIRQRAYTLSDQAQPGPSDSEAICFENDTHLLIADETTAHLYRVPIAELPVVRSGTRAAARADAKEAGAGGPAHAATHDSEISVASFNIRFGSANDGEYAWAKRREAVGAAIERWDADLLGLQEVEAAQADWLRARLPAYGFHGVGRTDGAHAGEFAPIFYRLSRFEWIEGGHFWLSPTPEVAGSRGWDAALERMASWGRLKDKSPAAGAGTPREILFINTHLDHKGVEARAQSVRLIRAKAEQLARGAEVIITGDFNTSADAPPASDLISPLAHTSEDGSGGLGLYDTFRRAFSKPDTDECTFCAWDTPPAKPLRLSGDRIDWIIASRGLETLWSDIDRRTPGGRLLSDHFPVRAKVRRLTK